MLRRIAIALLILFGINLIPAFGAVAAAAQSQPPTLHGRAAALIDARTGQLMFGQSETARNYPASTTKLLTALVAAEHGDLKEPITISEQAVNLPPDSSACFLEQGETHPLEYLMYGLLLPSGNDCANALAEGISGGRPDLFVAWMNQTAARLGAKATHFSNPSGLHDPEHYTTALDLALIARGALANAVVARVDGSLEFNWPGKSKTVGIYYNHNTLLFTYDGAYGGKTGFTDEAGYTLVSAARRGDRALIGVLMGYETKDQMDREMARLLDYGFDGFESMQVVRAGDAVGSLPVDGGEQQTVAVQTGAGFNVLVPVGTSPRFQTRFVPGNRLAAPVRTGAAAGLLEVREGDRVLGTVAAVTAGEVPVKVVATASAMLAGVFKPRPELRAYLKGLAGHMLIWTMVPVSGVFVLSLFGRARRALRRRRRRTYWTPQRYR